MIIITSKRRIAYLRCAMSAVAMNKGRVIRSHVYGEKCSLRV